MNSEIESCCISECRKWKRKITLTLLESFTKNSLPSWRVYKNFIFWRQILKLPQRNEEKFLHSSICWKLIPLKPEKMLHLNQCYSQNVNVNVLIWGTAVLILIPSTWWEVSWCISGSGKSILARIPKAKEEILQNKAERFRQGPGNEGLCETH